jgi:hypothetical protein
VAAAPGYRVRMDPQIKPKTGTGRPNTALAATVDQALAIALEQDARTAARFLTERGASARRPKGRATANHHRRQRPCSVPRDGRLGLDDEVPGQALVPMRGVVSHIFHGDSHHKKSLLHYLSRV